MKITQKLVNYFRKSRPVKCDMHFDPDVKIQDVVVVISMSELANRVALESSPHPLFDMLGADIYPNMEAAVKDKQKMGPNEYIVFSVNNTFTVKTFSVMGEP